MVPRDARKTANRLLPRMECYEVSLGKIVDKEKTRRETYEDVSRLDPCEGGAVQSTIVPI